VSEVGILVKYTQVYSQDMRQYRPTEQKEKLRNIANRTIQRKISVRDNFYLI